jgi:hypothetical protein
MATTTKKNEVHQAETVSAPEVDQAVTDLQAAGKARFAEVKAAVAAEFGNINTARANIVEHIRTIRNESLWVFAENSEGEGYTDWKSCVKDLLSGHLDDWSDRARNGFVVMLVDEGFGTKEAAEVTGQKPSEAKKAVDEANNEAEGKEAPEVTPPVEVTPAQKAVKVSEQAIAQNKRVADALYDMPLEALRALAIDYRGITTQIEQQLKVRTAEDAGNVNAA